MRRMGTASHTAPKPSLSKGTGNDAKPHVVPADSIQANPTENISTNCEPASLTGFEWGAQGD